MLLLKFVMPFMLDATANVSIAVVDCPAASCAPCLSHVRVMYVLAEPGDQLFVDKESDMLPGPVFLTYTVWVTLDPAATDPQVTVVMFWVQALSE